MKVTFKSLWSEFKAFAFKGNMIDLAVAVVIGAAFSGVINSLVKDVIMPSISYVTNAASEVKKTATDVAREAAEKAGFKHRTADSQPSSTQPATAPAAAQGAPPAPPAPSASPAAPPSDVDGVDIPWKIGRIQIGHFAAAMINFVLVAFAVFLMMVKVLGSAVRKIGRPSDDTEPTTKECPECLSIIPYKAKRCCHCTAILPPNPDTPPDTTP